MEDDEFRLGRRRVRVPRAIATVWPYVATGAGVAIVTFGIALAGRPDLGNASMLYLIVVLVAAVVWGRSVAIYSAIVAFFSFNWFLTEPRHTLEVADPDDWILLLLFLLTAVVTGQLAAGQRRRAEEAEEHERQARVLYDIAVALAEPTLERTLRTVAERLRRELGVGVVQIEMASSTGVTRAVSGDDVTALRELAGDRTIEVLTSGPSGGGRPGRWVRVSAPHPPAAGARHPRSVARAPIRGPDGGEVGQIAMVADPGRTFDARAARLLAAVTPQLWAALERSALRMEATETEVLRRSDEAKSALLDAVSHDLRTPLASIIASAGSLRQTNVQWSAEERAEFATAIEEQARRLDRIVGNLLDLSRIRAGSLHPDRAWYEPVALIRDVLARLAPTTAAHTVELALPDELAPVELDYSEVDQILTNLVENAARYSPPGSTIRVGAAMVGDALEVHVDDSGPGIEPADSRRIFEPFFRGRRPERPGIGLGLAVARGLVEAHGGRIRAEPRPGGGTRLAFTIPAGEGSA